MFLVRKQMPTRWATDVSVAIVVVAIGALATGCGTHETAGIGTAAATTSSMPQGLTSRGVNEAGKSSSQILVDTRRMALAARSVHVAGDVGDGVTIDMVLTNAGQAQGTLTESGKVEQLVVLNPTTVYAETSKTGGRYVRLRQADAVRVSKSFNMGSLIADALTPTGTAVKAGVISTGGRKQIGLKDTSDGSMLYVADNAAAPYPLRIIESGKRGVVFSDWNKTVTVRVPGYPT